MRPTLRAIGVLVFAVVAGTTACDSTSPDDFLPVITNAWRNVTNAAHTFQLNSTDDGQASGAFTGTEDHPTLGESDISGTFTNSTCQFTIARPGGNVTYSGKFVHADTLRLTRSQETLVIAKN